MKISKFQSSMGQNQVKLLDPTPLPLAQPLLQILLFLEALMSRVNTQFLPNFQICFFNNFDHFFKVDLRVKKKSSETFKEVKKKINNFLKALFPKKMHNQFVNSLFPFLHNLCIDRRLFVFFLTLAQIVSLCYIPIGLRLKMQVVNT